MVVWPIRGSSLSSPHSSTCSSPPSLSPFLSYLFSLSRVLSLVVSLPPLRRRRACAARGRSLAADEPVLEVLARDEAAMELQLASDGTTSSCPFWQILAPFDLLSRQDHLFWNELSIFYKTIPILKDESSLLKNRLLFTPCLPRLFPLNWGSVGR